MDDVTFGRVAYFNTGAEFDVDECLVLPAVCSSVSSGTSSSGSTVNDTVDASPAYSVSRQLSFTNE